MFMFRPAVKRIPTSDGVEILHRRYGNSLLREFTWTERREPTTDAIEILKRHFGYGLRRRLGLFLARIKLRKEKQDYTDGFNDGFVAGQKSKEKYPFLKCSNGLTLLLSQKNNDN